MKYAIMVDSVFIPKDSAIRYKNHAAAYIVMALAGNGMAMAGDYGALEREIRRKVDIAMFADCREYLRWFSRHWLGGKWAAHPDLLADTHLAHAHAILATGLIERQRQEQVCANLKLRSAEKASAKARK